MIAAHSSSLAGLTPQLADIEPGSRREARARRILEAAITLFKQHGYHKTGVRMIAESAGVSMGNLYQYIRQKEDLIYLAAAIPTADFRAGLSSVPAEGTVSERIVALFQELVNVVDRHRDELGMLRREMENLPESMRAEVSQMGRWVIGLFEAAINEGVATGQIHPCDAHLIGVSIHVIAHSWTDRAIHLTQYDVQSFCSEQTKLILRMIPFKQPVDAPSQAERRRTSRSRVATSAN